MTLWDRITTCKMHLISASRRFYITTFFSLLEFAFQTYVIWFFCGKDHREYYIITTTIIFGILCGIAWQLYLEKNSKSANKFNQLVVPFLAFVIYLTSTKINSLAYVWVMLSGLNLCFSLLHIN